MDKEKINKVISVYNYKKRFFLEFDSEQGAIIADNIAESLARKEHVEISFDRVPKVSLDFVYFMFRKLLNEYKFSVEIIGKYVHYTGLNEITETQIVKSVKILTKILNFKLGLFGLNRKELETKKAFKKYFKCFSSYILF